jgi:precorrin-6A/cobalt-precorrin-6A reductase
MAAVAALPGARANVFLAIGRQHIVPFGSKPQHAYTLRFIDPPDDELPLPDADVIVSRGPFTLADELKMMRSRAIEWIVARNSGGTGARAKIDAARELRLPVVIVARPELPDRPRTESVAEVMDWLGHRACLGA